MSAYRDDLEVTLRQVGELELEVAALRERNQRLTTELAGAEDTANARRLAAAIVRELEEQRLRDETDRDERAARTRGMAHRPSLEAEAELRRREREQIELRERYQRIKAEIASAEHSRKELARIGRDHRPARTRPRYRASLTERRVVSVLAGAGGAAGAINLFSRTHPAAALYMILVIGAFIASLRPLSRGTTAP
jgi:hypothetical protein